MAEEADHLALLDGEDVAFIGHGVDLSVGARPEDVHVTVYHFGFFHVCDFHVIADHGDAVGGPEIHGAVVTLGNIVDLDGRNPVFGRKLSEFSVFQQEYAVIIAADPQPVAAVGIQTDDAVDAGGGRNSFEFVSVIADQSAVTSDPQEPVAGLRNIIGLRGRQSVGVVIEHRGILVSGGNGIHAQFSGGVIGALLHHESVLFCL